MTAMALRRNAADVDRTAFFAPAPRTPRRAPDIIPRRDGALIDTRFAVES
jgi:hypothetical protein